MGRRHFPIVCVLSFLYICNDFENFDKIPVAIAYETSTLWRINWCLLWCGDVNEIGTCDNPQAIIYDPETYIMALLFCV